MICFDGAVCLSGVERLSKKFKMASCSKSIKQELFEDTSYYEHNDSSAAVSNVGCRRLMSSTPPEIDSTMTMTNNKPDSSPLRKRVRFDVSEENTPNGDNSYDQQSIGFVFCYEHYEASHSSRILSGLKEMQLNEHFVDLVLVVGEKEIPCHKVVLCSFSKYFSNLLSPNAAARYQQKIYITDTSAEIMMQLIDYMYSSKIKITDENVDELLSAATLYQFTDVRKACVMIFKQRLNPDNCIAIKRFASKQICTELVDFANTFLYENFAKVSASDDFLRLSLKELTGYISCESLHVDKEEVVFEAVMRWVQHKVSLRKDAIPQILEHVRLPLVKPQFLLDVVQSDPLVKSNEECESFLDEARRFHLLPDQRPLMQSNRTQPRPAYSSKKRKVLVTIGGLNKDKVSIPDCVYISSFDACTKFLAPLKVKQTAYSVAAVNNNIFVTGGTYHYSFDEVWMYVTSLNIWQEIAPMKKSRYLHASVGCCGYLYVIGGNSGSTRLRSVEKYCPDTNTWHEVEPMLRELSSPCAVTCDGHIYVVGGATGSSPNDIVCDVQCYNPKNDTWKMVAPLPQAERGAVAVCFKGTIYVMGQHKAVYSYNRQSNKWSKLRSTNGGHLHGAATVYNDHLCVAGGLHGNNYINGTIETYDHLHDSWQVTGTLHTPVYAQGLICILKDDDAIRP